MSLYVSIQALTFDLKTPYGAGNLTCKLTKAVEVTE